ncbi:hypothetical protein IEZ50_004683 [Salmonella enterica]|nr:hypothetical protein [Salmonella enterica]ECB8351184.1 hypothetical protein [Salmonella enterica subsp. enterica serovar Berta]EGQ8673363.1 hypothetical protein [Vibrio cholerae]EBK5174654.1 hypothetical protein [Salmonella enterica]ECS7776240.1 hypothetical protein [Salmonella enterica subsp. enterica serovar Berta]
MKDSVFVFHVKAKEDNKVIEFVVNESLRLAISEIEEGGFINKLDGLRDSYVVKTVRDIVSLGIEHFKANASADYNQIEISVLENLAYVFVLMNVGNYFDISDYE